MMKAVVLLFASLLLSLPLLCASSLIGAQDDDRCSLPPVTGPCLAHFTKFYYNAEVNRCQRFTYGGCRGNANRFATLFQCKAACARKLSSNPLCNLPKVAGMCMAYMPSFFYSTATGQCESFVYGGCQGNENRFTTLSECQAACTQKLSTNPQCNLPKEVGPCRALIPAFFYNTATGQCESFRYGGCQGNDNRFASLSDCETSCAVPTTFLSNNSQCNLPKEVGPCRALIPAFFYNTATGQCESFRYGGCQGNDNRFRSQSACDTSCLQTPADACSQPKRVGPCRASKPRWYYDQGTATCRFFIFGGCRGNDNNFRTAEQCRQRCVSSQQDIVL